MFQKIIIHLFLALQLAHIFTVFNGPTADQTDRVNQGQINIYLVSHYDCRKRFNNRRSNLNRVYIRSANPEDLQAIKHVMIC